MRAEAWGLVSPGLAMHPAWRKARARSTVNVGALLAMLAAWGARDASAWARALRAIA
jgi:hypothetical protein